MAPRAPDAGGLFRFFADRGGKRAMVDVSDAVGPLLEGFLAKRAEDAGALTVEPPAAAKSVVDADDVAALIDAALYSDTAAIDALCVDVARRGGDLADISVDLFQPALRVLGEEWLKDTASFTSVTLASMELQTVYRALAAEAFQRAPAVVERKMLLVTGGGQHTFGSVMVAELLRRAGWSVVEHDAAAASAARAAGAAWYDVVGFSVARAEDSTQIEKSIGEVRRKSRNPGVAVMVGGAAFVNHPDLQRPATADAFASDGREAVKCAGVLWARRGDRMGLTKRG